MSRSKLGLLPLGALALSLAACATAPSSPSVCPPIVEYDQEFMSKAADELDAIVSEGFTAIPQMIEDYGRERAMLRKCE